MVKSGRTIMMEKAIQKYFLGKYGITLKSEYRQPTYGRHSYIIDLFGIVYVKGTTDLEDAIAIEIKQSVNDFYSGHGLNFVGSSNYLAVPSELVGFGIEFLRENNLGEVGVIEVTNHALVRTVLYPSTKVNNDFVYMEKVNCLFTPFHLKQRKSD